MLARSTNRPTLLAFLTSGCSTCAVFWSALANPHASPVPGGARVVVVTKGAEAESPARLASFERALREYGSEVFEALGPPGDAKAPADVAALVDALAPGVDAATGAVLLEPFV